jgi:hypothetical protein
MKKPQLLDIACTLILLVMSSSANAAILASDDTSITGMDHSYTQTLAVSPSLFSGVAQTLDVLGDSDQTRADENFNFFIDGTSSESPHTDAPINFWLLLVVASVFGILSEIFHRKSFIR